MQTAAWLILLFPAAGTILIAFGFRVWPARVVGAIGTDGPTVPFGFGAPAQIGQALLTKFLVAFEVASSLLLIAAVGAVVLARRRGGIHDEEETRVAATAFALPPGIGTMAEAVEGRTGTPLHRELRPPAETADQPGGDGAAPGAAGATSPSREGAR